MSILKSFDLMYSFFLKNIFTSSIYCLTKFWRGIYSEMVRPLCVSKLCTKHVTYWQKCINSLFSSSFVLLIITIDKYYETYSYMHSVFETRVRYLCRLDDTTLSTACTFAWRSDAPTTWVFTYSRECCSYIPIMCMIV